MCIRDSDKTNEALIKQSIVQAEAGCDAVAPSDMMDGRVLAIRRALDEKGFQNTQIISYAAKYASSFYGPFREAVGSNSVKNVIDKSSYQMNPSNSDEAMREINLDINEGADMIIIKPGMPYLDIIYRASTEFNIPILAYQVSGEYSLLSNAIKNKILTPEYIERNDGVFLHRFRWLKDNEIGDLDKKWNWLAIEYEDINDPNLIHYTLGTPCFKEYKNKLGIFAPAKSNCMTCLTKAPTGRTATDG